MLKRCGVATGAQDGQIVGQMFDEVMKRNRNRKGKADLAQQEMLGETGSKQTFKETKEIEANEEDDPEEERRKIFGEESNSLDSEGNDQEREEEDEDEFMIVLQAVRERKKFEAEINRPLLKEKLSQTGWKLHQNFRIKSNAVLDDRDRIDIFTHKGTAVTPIAQTCTQQVEDDPNDCVILEY